jgi:aspartyl-tRNA(Asn)/glutamyl-tRNA(Gln) amidotransferase subunit C
MSSLSDDEVLRIAALARLALSEREQELFARQLAEILAYAEQIARVNTTGVTPTSHVQFEQSVLRDDEPRPSLPRDVALENATDADRAVGLFKVPKVIG